MGLAWGTLGYILWGLQQKFLPVRCPTCYPSNPTHVVKALKALLILVELISQLESAITMAKTTLFCHDAMNQLSFSPHPQCLVGFINNFLSNYTSVWHLPLMSLVSLKYFYMLEPYKLEYSLLYLSLIHI